MFKEIGCYLTGFVLVVFCFVGGNIISTVMWGATADYAGWFGPLRAVIATLAMIIFYFSVAPQMRFMQHRHVALPPILAGVGGLCLIGAIVGLSYVQGSQAEAISLEMISSLVPFVGWAGFGFWLMAQPAQSQT